MPDEEKQAFAMRRMVFDKLERLVNDRRLVFPPETHTELKRGNASVKDPKADDPYHFVDRCRETATRSASLDIVKELGAHNLVRRVTDPDAEHDEADIYVLAVALAIQRAGSEVGVLTQERRDSANKLSVTTACGLLDLICLPMEGFLHREGIWVWPGR
ncbi:MAG: DUF4411 family protein [Deltaproteobacteria bacterium]|nr:DUF4411 family protein [Kofleriaceae bacterium]